MRHEARMLARIGAPDRTRTCYPRLRRPMLYPIELRARGCAHCLSVRGAGTAPAPPLILARCNRPPAPPRARGDRSPLAYNSGGSEEESSMATVIAGKPSQRHDADFARDDVRRLRADLALALRAAAYHALGEGVCNHVSVALPDGSDRFLINPRGFHWSEIGDDDIVMVDGAGRRLAGRHDVEPTAMFIHAAVHRIARKACVLHTHMPYATALTVTKAGALDTTLSQNAMRFHGRVAVDREYNGAALDAAEGERIARAMQGREVAFLANHGVIVCGERIDW